MTPIYIKYAKVSHMAEHRSILSSAFVDSLKHKYLVHVR